MKRMLFIWYKRPNAIPEGGGQCSLRNYNAMCRLLESGHVDSLYIHDDDRKRPLSAYLRFLLYMPAGYYFGLYPKRVKQIVRQAMCYDYVFIDRSVFGILAKRLKEAGYKGRIITHFHNVETVYFDARLPQYMPLRHLFMHCIDVNDRYACRYADTVLTLNRRDETLLRQKYGLRQSIQIPIALADKYSGKGDTTDKIAKQPHCLFIGSYFPANTQGILWFVSNVLPHTDAQLTIVGKGMDRLRQEIPVSLSVCIESDVPDLAPFIEAADIVVLPIFSGSGMKVKTCEALMYGKNILGTDEAFEGYDADYNRVGGLCNTAEEFLAAISRLAGNAVPRFNKYSRQVFLDKYSEQAVAAQFGKVLD